MAQQLTENHLSPITREKICIPAILPQKNKKVVELQRQSMMLQRRSSVEYQKPVLIGSRIERSKSTDEKAGAEKQQSFEDLEEFKRKLTEGLKRIPASKLLLQSAPSLIAPTTTAVEDNKPEAIQHQSEEAFNSTIEEESKKLVIETKDESSEICQK